MAFSVHAARALTFAPAMTGVRGRKDQTMSESLNDVVPDDEEALSNELPDAALEVAASKCWELVGNLFTLAFCTGLDTCPH